MRTLKEALISKDKRDWAEAIKGDNLIAILPDNEGLISIFVQNHKGIFGGITKHTFGIEHNIIYVMQEKDFKLVCDKIKAKTKKHGDLLVYDIPAKYTKSWADLYEWFREQNTETLQNYLRSKVKI